MIGRVSASIHEFVADLRPADLDNWSRCDNFGPLVQVCLGNDPEWAARFDLVWLRSEGSSGRTTDIGIDLVVNEESFDRYAGPV